MSGRTTGRRSTTTAATIFSLEMASALVVERDRPASGSTCPPRAPFTAFSTRFLDDEAPRLRRRLQDRCIVAQSMHPRNAEIVSRKHRNREHCESVNPSAYIQSVPQKTEKENTLNPKPSAFHPIPCFIIRSSVSRFHLKGCTPKTVAEPKIDISGCHSEVILRGLHPEDGVPTNTDPLMCIPCHFLCDTPYYIP